eukprot:scpid55145/ scgid31671/ 
MDTWILDAAPLQDVQSHILPSLPKGQSQTKLLLMLASTVLHSAITSSAVPVSLSWCHEPSLTERLCASFELLSTSQGRLLFQLTTFNLMGFTAPPPCWDWLENEMTSALQTSVSNGCLLCHSSRLQTILFGN